MPRHSKSSEYSTDLTDPCQTCQPSRIRSSKLLADRAFELGYRDELDGLRCIAVLLVLGFHGAKTWVPGGWVGVDIFFVLSGFLITALLLAEFSRLGQINLKAFYIRRALRLFPALYSMLTAAFIFSCFLPEPDQQTIRGEIAAAGLHVWNYGPELGFWQSDKTWLYHTWSLSTEEQFYLVWPLLLSLLLINRTRLYTTLILTATLYAALSAYGTILIGCLLAIMFPPSLSRLNSRLLSLASVPAVLFLTFVTFYSPETTAAVRFFIAIAAATVILYLMHNKQSRVNRLLKWGPAVFVGKISYGVYLWHLLVFKVLYFGWGAVPSSQHKIVFIVKIALSFAVALFSYYLIELPFLRLKRRFKQTLPNKDAQASPPATDDRS